MVCIDSDVLIDFTHNVPSVVKKIAELRDKFEKLSITSVNSFELLVGIDRANKDKLGKLKDFLLNFNIYDFNFNSSEKASEIFNDLKSKGEILDLADVMIASIVMANNETLLTRNKKHFERISGLKLETI